MNEDMTSKEKLISKKKTIKIREIIAAKINEAKTLSKDQEGYSNK